MWPDNETTVDLLGFDYLVESLEVVLTESRLLPVTVGILGDWGSGKTSLLGMVGERLKGQAGYVVVPFSPWRYEAYEDVKAALMDAVLSSLSQWIPDDETAQEKKNLLIRLREKVARMMAGPRAAGRVLAPALGAALAPHAHVPPEMGSAAASAVVAGLDAVAANARETANDDLGTPAAYESVADFREDYEKLIDSLSEVTAVIVLIDDLDRCLDDTVIEVFEAVRLFLQVSSTAIVIAANRRIVQSAVERRYPTANIDDAPLGKDYLEKIIQVEIAVPPLAEPEAETYMNLLFASLRLDEGSFGRVVEEASERRRQGQFAVAMNYGIAKDLLGGLPEQLETDFTITNRIAPTLSRGLRGNPRQLKRFLNTMLLRLETASRRGVTLDPAVLAKLMILEQEEKAFQQLFLWQLEQYGAPEELAMAEAASAGSGKLPDGVAKGLVTWFGLPIVKNWLELEPPLTGVGLGEYFFFSRDRLSPAAPASRLTAPLQALLRRLQLQSEAQRRSAVDEAAGLSVEELSQLYDALLERARRKPDGEAMKSALELTERVPENWPAAVAMLTQIAHKDVPIRLPASILVLGKDRQEVGLLLDQWEASTVQKLKKAVIEARKGLT